MHGRGYERSAYPYTSFCGACVCCALLCGVRVLCSFVSCKRQTGQHTCRQAPSQEIPPTLTNPGAEAVVANRGRGKRPGPRTQDRSGSKAAAKGRGSRAGRLVEADEEEVLPLADQEKSKQKVKFARTFEFRLQITPLEQIAENPRGTKGLEYGQA